MTKKLISLSLSLIMLVSALFGAGFNAYSASSQSKVTSFKTSATCKKVTLKWKKQKNAAGYQIFVSTSKNGKYKKLKVVKKNTAVIKLKTGSTRYYKVRAYVKNGKKTTYGKFSAIKAAKTAHAPSTSWTIVEKATCAAEGKKTNICKYCKKKYSQSIEKDDTTHIYEATTVPADDINESYIVYVCKLCGDTYNSKIKQHEYTSKVTAPTCTEEGYTTYTCKKCDKSYKTDIVPALGHSFETAVVKEATCQAEGETANRCTVCGFTEEKTESISKLPHSFEEKVIIKPTCTSEGMKVNICSNCGFVDEDSRADIELAPHTFETVSYPANCTDYGYDVQVCSVCGYIDESTKKQTEPPIGTAHIYESETIEATCSEPAYTINVCTLCGYVDEDSKRYVEGSQALPHTFELKELKAPTCITLGENAEVCSVCGYIDEATRAPIEMTPHTYVNVTLVEAGCLTVGYTIDECSFCKKQLEETRTEIAALGHDYAKEYTTDEDGYRRYPCTRCDEYKLDATCYIDLGAKTVSNPRLATFGLSATNTTGVIDKLDIYTDEKGVADFEITGSASNLTIDINATAKTEVKLAGASITNDGRDCINVKDKSVDTVDENGVAVHNAPKVYISAKDATESTLTTTTSGNGFDSSCPLELRGHGTLKIVTAGTAVNNKAKLVIKNLTLNITSEKRGIDTELTTQVAGIGGTLVDNDEYFNVDIEPDANITIRSANDCIRCKNMTVLALAEGQTATVMNLTSTLGDGIQLEGNKGFIASSGNITITAGKYAFNCTADLITVNPPAAVNATGGTGYSKPAAAAE